MLGWPKSSFGIFHNITTWKPILKRQVWWTGKFCLFWMLTTRGKRTHFQNSTPCCPSVGKNFQRGSGEGNRWEEGYMQRQYSQLCHLESGLNSEHHLVLSTVNLQFQDWFVPISWRKVLMIMAIYVISTVWSSHNSSSTWWGFSIYKTAHRTWLRILSVALGRGTKSSWLCLMVKLFLLGLIWLLSFASVVSLFFDYIYSLVKVFLWTKSRQRTLQEVVSVLGRPIESCSVSLFSSHDTSKDLSPPHQDSCSLLIVEKGVYWCCSVTKLCPTLCNPMDWSTPVFPIFHHLLKSAQTHVHWVSDAIQPSYPLLPPSPTPPSFLASGSFPVSQFFS